MRPKRFDFDFADVDPDGLAKAQAVAGAGALSLDGDLISGGSFTSADGMGHQLGVLSAGDDSLITFTVVGTDANGKALSEAVAGSAGAPGTSETTKYFYTVSSVTASGAAAGNVSVGTVDEVESQTIPLDYACENSAALFADITGTLNYTIQECFDLFQETELAIQSVQWSAITAFSAKTADVKDAATRGATGIRFITSSYTNGAEAQLYVAQPVTT
jgi:hypothetical protein